MNHTAEEIYEFGLEALKMGDRHGANGHFEQVCLLNPNHAKAHAQRGAIAAEQGRTFDAMMNYAHSLALSPAPEVYNNLGSTLVELNQWDKGINCFRQAIKIRPELAQGWNNLGRALLITEQPDEARDAFNKAIEVNPDYAEAHLGLAFLALEAGRFEEGWREYEWRRKLTQPRHESIQEWQGQDLNGNGLLLTGEQGFGDAIQFCRFAPIIKQRYGGKVYIESRPPLYRLLQTLDGIDGVISYGDPVPDGVKYFSLMLSCPRLVCQSIDQIPSSPSYLKASPSRAESFAPFLKMLPSDSAKVGICWAGNAHMPSVDKRRSTNLEQWASLGEVPGIGWITLQKGPAASQLRTTRSGMRILDVINECDDMADTAALVMHCDLVITVDTAIAHLSAALGKPTWVLSRRDACWRWLGDRKDSPWYPTITHYRQKSFNDWPGLFAEVAHDLRNWVMTQ